MLFTALTQGVVFSTTQGNTQVEIAAIRFDSRQVQPGDLFVAVRGVQADGHHFIQKAIDNGAVAIVCETLPDTLAADRLYAVTPDATLALGLMAANLYQNPSQEITLVGITGTNGKTTVATLLYQLFTQLGYRCGLIGTVENRIGTQVIDSTHTTPDAVRLQEWLRQMADAGCTYVFMEVSSHAVHQRRIAGAVFKGGVFTNITHDHLDYHGTFAEYRDAKKLFFDELPTNAFALTNVDDRNGMVMLQNTKARKYTYGLKKTADYKTKMLENTLTGLFLQLDDEAVHMRMMGEFNAYNLTAAYATARLLDADKIEALTALSNLRGAEGRFDYLVHPTKQHCIGIIDYAHTPDALEKVLDTIHKLKQKQSNIITVVGCGGDRDKTKRPIMAKVAAKMSDHPILTSDNPRTENPADILRDMEAGLDAAALHKTLIIENREQAIKTACRLANPGDVILVAGKGHEKYQDIMGTKYPFDDKAILQLAFSNDTAPKTPKP